MAVRVVVEDDAILRAVPVIIDPDVEREREESVADFYRHDVPDFLAWRDALRASIPGLFPAEVVFVKDQQSFQEQLAGASVAIVESLLVGEEELGRADALRAVLKFGGLATNIDLLACQRRGVVVEVQRRRVNVAVAEHALLAMLALGRRLSELDGLVTEEGLLNAGFDLTPFDRRFTGNSNFARVGGLKTLAGSTLALIGLGEIGREIASRAAAFEMRIRYHQRHRVDPLVEWRLGATYGSLLEVVADADFVSVNLPVNAETTGIVSEELTGAMKPGAVLINVARAELMERDAVIAALDSGQLGGLALDVGYEEPTDPGDPLLGRTNVLLTPHSAVGSRWNAIRDMEEMYQKLWRALGSDR